MHYQLQNCVHLFNFHQFPPSPPQNVINAKTSSSLQRPAEGRRPSPEQRLSQRPATLPRAQGSNVHRDSPGAFFLDLHNFPDLSKADINGQNPNIQVTMCVCAPAPAGFDALHSVVSHGYSSGQDRKRKQEEGATVWCTSLPPFFLPLSVPLFTLPGDRHWDLASIIMTAERETLTSERPVLKSRSRKTDDGSCECAGRVTAGMFK